MITAIYRPLLWVDNLTCRLKKSLRADFPNIVMATRNDHTINQLFSRTKDRIPPSMRTNVIYKIPCHDCDKVYVGLTTQYLKARVSRHQSDVNKLEELLNTHDDDIEIYRLRERSALINHSIEQQHRFSLEDAEIMDHHRRKSALEILEMCHIATSNQTVNKRSDVDGLSSTFAGILHLVKENTRKKKQKQNTNVREEDRENS